MTATRPDLQLQRATSITRSADRIVVLTGAGISTDSGIPDFRGPNGVWTRNPAAEKMSTLSHYLNDRSVREQSWQVRLHNHAWTARPNSGHMAIASLAHSGRLHALITQNVDGLHQLSGIDAAKVIEVHGTMRLTRCWSCDDVCDMADALDRVRAGAVDPECMECGGILKSDTISFGQSLVPEVIDAAFAAACECDLLVAIGTTLQVYPVAQCVPHAKAAGASVIIVNAEPTAHDAAADVVLTGSISEILPPLFEQ